MSLRIAVLQPSYLPWLGYFDQIARVDAFVFYDDVQYDKNGWRNRNRIRTAEGWQWLTVPVALTGSFGAPISEVEIVPGAPWARKHLAALAQWYSRTPWFDRYFPLLEEALSRPWERLAELDVHLTVELCRALGLPAVFYRSSELGVGGERSERLLRLCEHFGAREYLTGDAARDYLDVPSFEARGIEVHFQEYRHPTYPQRYEPFVSHLSVVDLLFNCGEESLSTLRNEDREPAGEPLPPGGLRVEP